MVAKEEGQIWRITGLELEHNHDLQPGKHFDGHKYLTDMEKALIRTLNESNIPTRKMVTILSNLRGGPTALPVKKKDISNIRTKINREVRGSDMTKLLDNFRNKKSDDPSFFYKFDLDEENRVKNIFWRDGSSLKYYEEYGDCVSFDTTYMTNKYRLSFAPFVGITGHAQTCLFGCAFLHDETAETFKWVFETFLESMGGKHPRSIITDQDKAMKAAIPEVFPNTRHRNCLFHIKNKCYNKNLKVFAKNKGLYEIFEDTVNNCLSEEEFEYLWGKMIEDKKLENNKYFTRMWETRERFIPVYYKHDFFPFIQTTSRSEAVNARFKENVGPTYSIHSFFSEYQRMIETIDRAENLEDHYSVQKRQKDLMFGYTFEIQAEELYNRNIYKKFQLQLKATSTLAYKEIQEDKVFQVWQRSNQVQKLERIRKYTVLTDLREGVEEMSCICAKFNKDGVLCSHILNVMIEKEISRIPDKYIIDRWRKRDLRMVKQRIGENTADARSLLRFNMLSRQSTIINSKASKREEATKYLMAEMNRIDLHLETILMSETTENTQEEVHSIEVEQIRGEANATVNNADNNIGDPETTTKRGKPALPKRMKPLIEQEREKMKQKENKKKKKVTANESTGKE